MWFVFFVKCDRKIKFIKENGGRTKGFTDNVK